MSPQFKGFLLAFAGICILSPDTLVVRLLDMEQWQLQAYRGLGVAVGLTIGMIVLYRGRAIGKLRAIGLSGLLVAASHALASLLFVSSLYHTSVANTLAIISTAPIHGALLSRLLLSERLPGRTWAAIVLTFCAIAVIVAGDIGGSGSHLLGDLLALTQAVFMALTFVLVRRKPDVNMVPCMVVSGLIIAAFSLPLAGSLAVPASSAPLLALLGLVILPVSFMLLFLAPRYIPAPEVNMIMLLEMLLGPLLVWAVVNETIPRATIVGGALLFLVLLTHSFFSLRASRASLRA